MLGLQIHWIYAHLIGDYLIQNDWMAKNKKSSTWVCLFHVVTYLIPFLFTSLSYPMLILIGLEHFLQDRTNIIFWFMEKTGKNKFNKEPMAPWSIIVTDNIVHILFIEIVVRII